MLRIRGSRLGSSIPGNTFLLVCALVWLFPFYWAVMGSFKTERSIFAIPPEFLPTPFTFNNYIQLLRRTNTLQWFTNSMVTSLSVMVLVCILSSLAGYAFAKLRFRGRDAIFYLMISTMMLPHYVLLVPLFRLMKTLGWLNTYAGLIFPEIALPFGVFMMRQFIKSIPTEIIEAARIDGCSEFGIFARMIVPLTKPALGALAIFAFQRSWNDYMWHLIVVSSDNMKTLPLGIAGLQQETMIHYGQMMAGATLSALPLIIVFILFQSYFTRGLTLGAVKG